MAVSSFFLPAAGVHFGARLLSFLGASARFAIMLGLTLLGLAAVTFAIGRVIPIDPVLAVVGDHASPETYARVREEMALDRPLLEQFLIYLGKIANGDLGTSVLTSQPVLRDLLTFFPATLELATAATVLGVVAGIPLGVLAAVKFGRWQDDVVRVVSLIGYSTPIFWLGLVGLLLLYSKLGWVSGPGRLDVYYNGLLEPVTGLNMIDALLAGEIEIFRNAVSHLVLPAALLGYVTLAYVARMTRGYMLDELRKEYVLTARAKGMSERRVVWRHALANLRVPLLTVIVLSYTSLLEGAVITETVFAWPGIGLYITQSLFNADLNAVLGGTLLIGAIFVTLNQASDLLGRLVDPRVS